MMHFNKIIAFIILSFAFSCEEELNHQDLTESPQSTRLSLEEMNRYQAKQEKLKINAWIDKRPVSYKSTGTGLRYHIVEKQNDTTNIASGMRVRVNLSVFLLDDKEIYNTKATGHYDFSISYDLAESGLHEACTYMNIGDSMSIIMPSHLAHGNFGDFKSIPPFSPIRMEVRMINAVK